MAGRLGTQLGQSALIRSCLPSLGSSAQSMGNRTGAKRAYVQSPVSLHRFEACGQLGRSALMSSHLSSWVGAALCDSCGQLGRSGLSDSRPRGFLIAPRSVGFPRLGQATGTKRAYSQLRAPLTRAQLRSADGFHCRTTGTKCAYVQLPAKPFGPDFGPFFKLVTRTLHSYQPFGRKPGGSSPRRAFNTSRTRISSDPASLWEMSQMA